MRGDGVNEGYHIHEIAMHEVFGTINSFYPDRYYTDCDCGWKGREWYSYGAAELEASTHIVSLGLPRCSTCDRAVIYSSIFGFCHWAIEFQNGVPPHIDSSCHEVVVVE